MSIAISGNNNINKPLIRSSKDSNTFQSKINSLGDPNDRLDISDSSKSLIAEGLEIDFIDYSIEEKIFSISSGLLLDKLGKLNTLIKYNDTENTINMRMAFGSGPDFSLKPFELKINANLLLQERNRGIGKTTPKKEDILGFVRKLGFEILKLAGDRDKNLKSITLDKEDLEEIMSFQDEKGRNTLLQLINLVVEAARMKQEALEKKNAKDINYHPERKNITSLNKEINGINILDINVGFSENILNKNPDVSDKQE